MSDSKIVYLKDGDTLGIIVKVDASVWDPALSYPGVSKTYRVVASQYGPTLELVSIGEAIRLTTLGDKNDKD